MGVTCPIRHKNIYHNSKQGLEMNKNFKIDLFRKNCNFTENFSTFWKFITFLEFLKLFWNFLNFFGNFSTFWKFFNFLEIFQLFGKFSTFWNFFNFLDFFLTNRIYLNLLDF